ncbi:MULTISPECIES: flavodoxin [Nocardia]|uniref:flavodoxin n=1 Tax=Nocardia TaxID=1817 RepID=UPI0018E53020|nr:MULTISPECIES: flavodoxin [Nocardia]
MLLGSPVWNSRAPRIMSTFIDGLDVTGKTVLTFVTYAVSGMSGIDDFYRRVLTTATVATGLAVRGEEVHEAGGDVDRWLRENDLATR